MVLHVFCQHDIYPFGIRKNTFTKANAPRFPVAHGLKLVVQLKVESDLFRPVGVGHCIVTNK